VHVEVFELAGRGGADALKPAPHDVPEQHRLEPLGARRDYLERTVVCIKMPE
jgi:hypothetical protein